MNTGTDALVVRTGSGAISANFLGSAGGASYDGKVIFYKDFQVLGNQTVGGNSTITGNLINNGINLLTSLNGTNAILTGAADNGSQSVF